MAGGLTAEAVSGAAAALAAALDGTPVFADAAEQGVGDGAAVFVRSAGQRQEQVIGERYRRSELIEAAYYPAKDAERRDADEALDRMMAALEFIRAGGETLRGTDMEARVDEETGIAVLTVSYRYFARKETEAAALMSVMDERTRIGRTAS